jgi:scyllo-inositol 2-dehydrogenase (NADP+)
MMDDPPDNSRSEPIRVAVVGFGEAFGVGRSHLRRIVAVPRLTATAVCDPDPTRLDAAIREFRWLRVFDSLTEMLAADVADCYTIAVPNHLHAQLGLECLRAGKHVILEKPMCLTTQEARLLLDEARVANAMLAVYHNRRLDGSFIAVSQAVRSGQLGDVYRIELARAVVDPPVDGWRTHSEQCGGPHYDWGAHLVDWLLTLAPSPPRSVAASFQHSDPAHHGLEDHVDLSIYFDSGLSASVQLATRAAAPRPAWRILGSHGGLLLRGFDDVQLEIWTCSDTHSTAIQLPVPSDARHRFYENVAAHLCDGEPLLVSVHEAARVVTVLEASTRSANDGGELVRLSSDVLFNTVQERFGG